MKRRDFVKTVGGVTASLFFDPFHCLAKNIGTFKTSDVFFTSEEDDIRVDTRASYRTIFTQFENQDLKTALEEYAEEIDCGIWCGEPSSPDIIAVPCFVSIIDTEAWNDYLWYIGESEIDIPCIIVGETKDLASPGMRTPKNKKVFCYDISDKHSIPRIIAAVKEIRLSVEQETTERLSAIETLEADLKALRNKYPDSILDGINHYDSFAYEEPKLLWILQDTPDKGEGGWDLRKILASPERVGSYNVFRNKYAPLTVVSLGILLDIPPDEVDYKNDTQNYSYILGDIAVININKLPPISQNYNKDLQKAFHQFKDTILNQVEYIDPDIIIGEDTLWLFNDILQLTESEVNKSCECVYSFEKANKLWININHPALFQTSPEKYYPDIMKKVKSRMEV